MYSSFSPVKKIVIMSTLLLLLGLVVVLYLSIKAEGSQVGQWVDVNKQMEEVIKQVSATHHSKETKGAATEEGLRTAPVKGTQITGTTEPQSVSTPLLLQQPTPSLALTEAPIEAAPGTTGLININTATAEELDELPGIGPSKAKAIVDHRLKIGGFSTLEQLMDVKGIGPAIFAKMRGKIKLN